VITLFNLKFMALLLCRFMPQWFDKSPIKDPAIALPADTLHSHPLLPSQRSFPVMICSHLTPQNTHTYPVYKKVQGVEYPSVLRSMNNIVLTLHGQGKYAEAEQMHRQVLEVKEKVLGREHSSTIDSMNNLVIPLYSQGKSRRTGCTVRC
jgi:hypothetical protein